MLISKIIPMGNKSESSNQNALSLCLLCSILQSRVVNVWLTGVCRSLNPLECYFFWSCISAAHKRKHEIQAQETHNVPLGSDGGFKIRFSVHPETRQTKHPDFTSLPANTAWCVRIFPPHACMNAMCFSNAKKKNHTHSYQFHQEVKRWKFRAFPDLKRIWWECMITSVCQYRGFFPLFQYSSRSSMYLFQDCLWIFCVAALNLTHLQEGKKNVLADGGCASRKYRSQKCVSRITTLNLNFRILGTLIKVVGH